MANCSLVADDRIALDVARSNEKLMTIEMKSLFIVKLLLFTELAA